MPIHVTCPSCGKTYDVPDSRAGHNGNCSCGASIPIPAPPKSAAVQPPPAPRPIPTPPPPRPPAPQSGTFAAPAPDFSGPPDLGGTPDLNATPNLNAQQPPASPYPPPANPYAPPAPPTYQPPGAFGNRISNTRPERPTLLTVMIILQYIGTGLIAIIGLLMAVAGGFMAPMIIRAIGQAGSNASEIPEGVFTGIMVGGGIFVLLISAFFVFCLYSLWQGRNWARILWIVLTMLSLLMGLPGLGKQGSDMMVQTLIGLAFNGLFLYALFMPGTRDYCDQ